MATKASARKSHQQNKERPTAPSIARFALRSKKQALRDVKKNKKVTSAKKIAQRKKSGPHNRRPSAAPASRLKSKLKKQKARARSRNGLPVEKRTVSVPTKPSPAGTVFIDSCELPVRYGRTGVTLIARDPHSVYAYWEITPSSLGALRAKLGGSFQRSTRTLRMFDVTGINFNGTNAKRQFDVDVDAISKSRYIILPNDKATLFADLGFRTKKGMFYPLARSNFVSTPSAEASDELEITWAKVRHKRGSKPSIVAQTILPAREERQGDRVEGYGHEISGRDEPEEKEPKQGKEQEVSAFKEPDREALAVRSAEGSERTTEYGDRAPVALSEEIAKDQRASDEWPKSMTSSFTVTNSSFEMGKNHFSADIPHVSSETYGGASEQRQRKRDFFFQLDGDLIIYGRTEPGARVTMNDYVVDLREDGTFTQRLSFPDGVLPLDFTARPPDGSITKTIFLTAERSTTVYK